MNITRTIEAATLMAVGIFCATAVLNIALHSSNLLPGATSGAAVTQLPPVTITAKRLSAAERAVLVNEEQRAAAGTMLGNHSSKNPSQQAG
jgi:hypothetical protein